VNLDELARDAAEALRHSVERAVPDRPRLARARRRGPAAAVAVALLVTVALASASLWVRANAPERPSQTIAPAQPGPTAPGQRPGGWRRLRNGPGGLWVDQMVWTGTRALVFAGATSDQSKVDGALYDPGRDRWQAIRSGPLDWRAGAAVAWTGQRLLVWGGTRDVPLDRAGGAYDPATDTWTPIAAGPLQPGAVMAAAWTGRELLVWLDAERGAAYDPRQDAWRRLSAAFPLPQANRDQPAVVWTGREVILWGGCDGRVPQCDDGARGDGLSDGAAYDPASDRWRRLAASPLAARDQPQGAWTGRELVVWGGDAPAGGGGAYAAAYDPATDRWRTLPAGPLSPRSNHIMVWTGRELLVWGGVASGTGDRFLADGAALDPATGRWTPLPGAPIRGRDRHVAVWTGQELLVWGGCCAGTQLLADGAAFRPP
jgi:N-acetylneuraminic acid mutarotase